MKPLHFNLRRAGVLAPGIPSLDGLRALARAETSHAPQPLALPGPSELPSAERRRASQAVRLVLACISQVLPAETPEATQLHSVFATDEGTGEVCQQMLESLATTRQISPMLFTNSVHNAPSGYFSIAWRNPQPATVVSLGLESFACGLVCAVTEATATGRGVLLVAADPALTAPLDELVPVLDSTASAWIIDTLDGGPALGRFAFTLAPKGDSASADDHAPWLPAAWAANSSTRALTALGLLDAPAHTRLRFGFGAQQLALWRVETP